MIKGLHHIAMIVSAEKTVDFYKELGFEETDRRTRPYDTVVFLKGHSIELELFVDACHPRRDLKAEPFGVRYFSLRVDNLEEMVGKYEDAVIRMDWHGEKYCEVRDPDGLIIQLHE